MLERFQHSTRTAFQAPQTRPMLKNSAEIFRAPRSAFCRPPSTSRPCALPAPSARTRRTTTSPHTPRPRRRIPRTPASHSPHHTPGSSTKILTFPATVLYIRQNHPIFVLYTGQNLAIPPTRSSSEHSPFVVDSHRISQTRTQDPQTHQRRQSMRKKLKFDMCSQNIIAIILKASFADLGKRSNL